MVNSQIKKPKILVGFSEIAGYYVNLFVGLAQLGNEVGYINNRYFKFQYNEYKKYNHPFLNYYIEVCRKFRVENSFFNKVLCGLLSPLVIFWIVLKYDVFILGSDSTLLKYWEYKVLRFFKKKIIYVSLGSDTRPSIMSGIYKDDSKGGQFSVSEMVGNFIQTKNKVEFFEEHADIFINYPQHAHFNRRPFINGMNIGFPTVMREIEPDQKNLKGNSVRILHAPSRPNAKGTAFFRKIVDELKSEGIDIDWVEIVNKPNSEVMKELILCDLVLDELYSDLPLGGLGSEAASFGKPVLLGGYYAEFIKTEISKDAIPPSFYVLPDQIKETLRMLCLSPELRENAGSELHQFVSKNWNSKTIAQKFLDLISGDFDRSWLFFPEKISYYNGWGLSRTEAVRNMEET
ncbi:glycosyltransferase family 1 protein [Algoriphagus lacus]|uniref:Glycosyltransferase family 1 protein n=1 Tax=Algoriphagus lacus TaxID=2056311 RepID=A0A418PLQ6_9BACT|nr:glycosyltransferase [Algoriphagus lacus]RIW12361.1 glycosyltransferase family 1 protein [Algoriphagus lacus]